jgi:iron complex outermembrane receptor protein
MITIIGFHNFGQFPGCSGQSSAEIKPVEPDQDNACAGKEDYYSILSCFCKPKNKNSMKKLIWVSLQLVISLSLFSQVRKTEKDTAFPSPSKLMPSIEIKAVRAAKDYPFPQTTISKNEIGKKNLGQDIPFLLNQIPGAVANADAGNGIGYTGLRIRGTDPNRINFTINGIAYNDAESQGVFLVNLPDILSSTNSIQVQRGAGTSSNGTGAFGATVNLLTNEVNEKAYSSFSNSWGSYNTRKHTLKAGTGLINKQFTVDFRLSSLRSDGYIDRASSDLNSYYFSAASVKEKSSLRLNIFSGKEKTYQAWYGVPEEQLKTNRRINIAGTDKPGDPYENETDNYQQTHYQLFYNKKISTKLNFNAAVFTTTGKGYYEQYKADQKFSRYGLANPIVNGTAISRTDLIRQLWLDNRYTGTNFSFQYKNENREIIGGGGASEYKGNHFGKIIWANTGIAKDQKWYDHDAFKDEQHLFTKWMEKIGKFHLFGDLQIRHVGYQIDGFRDNPTLKTDNNWLFFNPKAGIRYTANNLSAFVSYAKASKEPNRDDFEAGASEVPRPEKLNDLEAGIETNLGKWLLTATLYHMNYRDQLVLTGKVNDVGAYTRTNIPKSYRTGIEIETNVPLTKWLSFSNNIALSQNRISSFTDYADDYASGNQIKTTYTNTNIAFSPSLVDNATLTFTLNKYIEARWITKYVSRQYLDNTSRKNRSLDPFFVQDLNINFSFPTKKLKNIELIAQVNNLWSTLYAPNGYTFTYFTGRTEFINNYYYPMAERNFMIGLTVDF